MENSDFDDNGSGYEATGAVIGGILFGPIGMLIGGALGAVARKLIED